MDTNTKPSSPAPSAVATATSGDTTLGEALVMRLTTYLGNAEFADMVFTMFKMETAEKGPQTNWNIKVADLPKAGIAIVWIALRQFADGPSATEPAVAPTGKITAARITNLPQQMCGPLPEVFVTVDGKEVRLFDYYSDEISFSPEEFVGLTVAEAHALKQAKDKAYLQS